ncbi:MAG: hypothetical protein AB2L11_01195 [Syntrophobacteraceae bacterium]
MAHFLRCLLLLLVLTSSVYASDESEKRSAGWHTIVNKGVYWLVAPDGRLFYSKGVNSVDSGKENEQSLRKEAYWWRNFYPSIEEWRRSVGTQLREWGFNTRGGWSDPSGEIDLALTVDLELGRNSKFHWFDPFDPSMEKITAECAQKLTAPYRNDPRLIGYFSDNEVGWWNSPLFVWYLGKGWKNHTKRVLWQLLHDHYKGDWKQLLIDWVPQGSIKNFEDLKKVDAAMKLRVGGRGIHVVDRFMRLCAQHYYKLMYTAIRKAHPGALVLGDRLPLYYHQDAVLAIGDNIDVISTNYNVDVPDGWVAPYYFDGLRRLTAKPVLVTEFFFAAEENRTGNRNETARSEHPKPGHLMTVKTQAERAGGLAEALQNFAAFPNLVGIHWFQYCDEPRGGREDGEDYNMGLIDTANRPYEEVTNVFRSLNPRLDSIHQEGGPANAASSYTEEKQPTAVARTLKPIDVTDQSLMDWDKKSTRLADFQAPQPYAPFGDVHLAWSPEGIYLASIANTYVDPAFLAYEGDFPLSEAFQIHFVVQVGEKINHFAIHLIPKPNPEFPDGFEVLPILYRYKDEMPTERLPVQGRVQRLDKSLPHMAVEAFFPAEWFGMKQLQPETILKANVHLANYYNEHIMSWSGSPSLQSVEDPRSLKAIVLRNAQPATAD